MSIEVLELTERRDHQEKQDMELNFSLVNIPIQDANNKVALQEIGVNATTNPKSKRRTRWRRATRKEN